MNLNQIFTNQRTGNNPNTKASRTDFQRDFDRIIFSSAFRRLQNKTQVFRFPEVFFSTTGLRIPWKYPLWEEA